MGKMVLFECRITNAETQRKNKSEVSCVLNTGSLEIIARCRAKRKPKRKRERTKVKGTDGR